MSQAATTSSNAMSIRGATIRGFVVVGILAVAYGTVCGLESLMNAVFDKPPAPLSRPLPEMKLDLPGYTHVGPDQVLDEEMAETLGTTDYLVRLYQQRNTGQFVNLNVNYYATGTSTPHVPEVCWKGVGMVEVLGARKTFTVPSVQRKDKTGKLSALTMRMISFAVPGKTTNEEGKPIYCNVAYVFHVNGMYVPNTEDVTSLFWKAEYRYAYHAKIEITPLEARPDIHGQHAVLVCTQEEAQKIIGDFISEALPEVEACLPDPAILTGSEREPNQKSSEQR